MPEGLMFRLLMLVALSASLIGADAIGAEARLGACDGLTIGVYNSPDCDAEMAADPIPPVVGLAVDQEALWSYTYMQIVADDPVQVLNSPNGLPLYTIDAGFNFVTPRRTLGDWVEINAHEWVRSDQLAPVEPSPFTGVFIQAEPSRPFGWLLKTLYASDRPGGPPILSRDYLLPRFRVTYVYATVNVDGLDWYLVAPGKWVEQRLMGLVRRVQRPGELQGRWVAVDLYEQTLVAYENDTMVFATLVSSGLPGFSTYTGIFHVWGQRLNGPMTGAEGKPDYYHLENVPYVLYFDGDISLHGTYWHDGFGYRHSHGCVNLSVSDAHWMYDWLGIGGGVYVYYSRQY
jgi:hypothetical protein